MSIDYYICGAYNPQTKRIGALWLVMPVPNDHYQSGQSLIVNGKEYLLGRRDLIGRGEISSYELIVRSEVLELE